MGLDGAVDVRHDARVRTRPMPRSPLPLLACLAVVVLAPLPTARAKDAAGEAETTWAARRAYHRALRRVDLAEIGLAAGSLAYGGYAVSRDDPFHRAFGGTFLAAGAVHLGSGIAYTIRSQRGLRPLHAPAWFREGDPLARELEAAEAHAERFIVFLLTDAGVIAAGLGTALAGYARERDAAQGVGLALGAQGLATLVLDLFHQNQGRAHLEALRDIDAGIAMVPALGGQAWLARVTWRR